MFIAAYWWKVHPGKEEQFRAAWRRGTVLIREKYGSLGSRLHREELADGSSALRNGRTATRGRKHSTPRWFMTSPRRARLLSMRSSPAHAIRCC